MYICKVSKSLLTNYFKLIVNWNFKIIFMNFKIKFAKLLIKVLKIISYFCNKFSIVLNFCNKIFKIFLICSILVNFYLNIVEFNVYDTILKVLSKFLQWISIFFWIFAIKFSKCFKFVLILVKLFYLNIVELTFLDT